VTEAPSVSAWPGTGQADRGAFCKSHDRTRRWPVTFVALSTFMLGRKRSSRNRYVSMERGFPLARNGLTEDDSSLGLFDGSDFKTRVEPGSWSSRGQRLGQFESECILLGPKAWPRNTRAIRLCRDGSGASSSLRPPEMRGKHIRRSRG
jgi:hypothetical protein